jgi:hypothetical protein
MATVFARRAVRLAVLAAGLVLVLGGTARAQSDPNPGALTFTGGLDVLPGSTYVFRGIVQESDPKLTLWPYGDLGIALSSGYGSVKSVGINFGVWNSLHTGSAGSDGPGPMHYEEDFYSTLTLGFGKGVSVATTYTAYTSPNGSYDTVNELMFKVAMANRVAPYGILAFEMGDGSADLGNNAGTYLELGVGPAFPLGSGSTTATLTIPVKIGLSLSDYYEHPETGEDEAFGFFDFGASVALPLSGIPASFGSWNVHGGIDFLFLGNTTEAFNGGDNAKVTGLFGIGLTY